MSTDQIAQEAREEIKRYYATEPRRPDQVLDSIIQVAIEKSIAPWRRALEQRIGEADKISLSQSDDTKRVAKCMEYLETTAKSLRVMGDKSFAQSMDNFVTAMKREEK